MTNLSEDKERLIARYLNGDISELEIKALRAWMNENPENKKLYLSIKDVWDASRKENRQTEQFLLNFYRQKAFAPKAKYKISWKVAISAAAILVFGLIIGVSVPKFISGGKKQMERFIVPLGSRSEICLSDGTKIHINSGSQLLVDENFSPEKRIVSLTGEAYFEVKSDKAHPFVVNTDRFKVAVTGTKFNVCTYPEDLFTSATLEEGRIRLRLNDKEEYVMNPGEKLQVDRASQATIFQSADVESEIAWKNGDFIFKEVKLPDLLKRFERWYDVRLSYSDEELDRLVFSGRFKNQETIWQALDALKLTSPIDYTKKSYREFELSYKPMKK